MVFEYAVALTGSIATGKSTVARMFEEDGFVIIDADSIAHEVLESQQEVIARMFGDEVVRHGTVDRKALGKVVFADSLKRKALEQLLHPLIYDVIEARAKEEDAKQKPYIVDIPLFFEGGRYPIKRTLVVYAAPKQQLERAMMRDGLDEEAVLERIASQIDIAEKRFLADYVIDNTKDEVHLRSEYEQAKDAILKEFS